MMDIIIPGCAFFWTTFQEVGGGRSYSCVNNETDYLVIAEPEIISSL
jgi:hypothetical protein